MTADVKMFEYGILNSAGEVHRSGMTESEAKQWMNEWVQMTGRRAPFRLARRPVGEWEDDD